MRTVRVTLLVCAALALAHPGPSFATARHVFTYRGAGYTLKIHARHASYGSTLQGSLTFKHRTYHVEGDWIPAGDAGGDLLRFYGHPFPNNSFIGLISVATLYNMCQPNCAQGVTYALTTLANWRLPGSTTRSVRLVLR